MHPFSCYFYAKHRYKNVPDERICVVFLRVKSNGSDRNGKSLDTFSLYKTLLKH